MVDRRPAGGSEKVVVYFLRRLFLLYHEVRRNGIVAHQEAVAGVAQPERRAVAQKWYNNRFALRAARSEKEGGAWGGSRISVWTTPCLRV